MISSPSKLLFSVVAFLAMGEGTQSQETPVEVEEVDGDWGGLLKSCPMKITRLTPCIDTDSDLSQCTTCVTKYAANSKILSGDNTGANATTVCTNVQSEVCSGVDQCGESCGLITSDGSNGKFASFFQFGSDCETLFLDLVMCALEAEDFVTSDCSLDTCSVNGTATSGSSSLLPMSNSVVAILGVVASGVVSLL